MKIAAQNQNFGFFSNGNSISDAADIRAKPEIKINSTDSMEIDILSSSETGLIINNLIKQKMIMRYSKICNALDKILE